MIITHNTTVNEILKYGSLQPAIAEKLELDWFEVEEELKDCQKELERAITSYNNLLNVIESVDEKLEILEDALIEGETDIQYATMRYLLNTLIEINSTYKKELDDG